MPSSTPANHSGMKSGNIRESEPENKFQHARDSLLATLPELTIGEIPHWGPRSAEGLLSTVVSQEHPFPCTFAVAAARKRTLRFGFVDGAGDRGDWAALPDLLRRYLEGYQALGKDTSFVVFFRPEPGGAALPLDGFRQRFWDVLGYLADKDSSPWPAELPTDPDDPLWEFTFGGVPIFVVCNTPAHGERRSRHAADFMITFQPRWVFEGLEADSPRGAAARRTIRARLRAYDTVPPSPALGSYGDTDNREWRQYFLPDADDGPPQAWERCPFLSARTLPGPAARAPRRPDTPDHQAVRNDAGRFSVWPSGRRPPAGWSAVGPPGTRAQCLARAAELWGERR